MEAKENILKDFTSLIHEIAEAERNSDRARNNLHGLSNFDPAGLFKKITSTNGIRASQLKSFLDSHNQSMDDEQIRDIISSLDRNNDGVVGWGEFLHGFVNRNDLITDDFSRANQNPPAPTLEIESGFVETLKAELVSIEQITGAIQRFLKLHGQDNLNAVVKAIEKGKGFIDINDLISFLGENKSTSPEDIAVHSFYRLDHNADGRITKDDWDQIIADSLPPPPQKKERQPPKQEFRTESSAQKSVEDGSKLAEGRMGITMRSTADGGFSYTKDPARPTYDTLFSSIQKPEDDEVKIRDVKAGSDSQRSLRNQETKPAEERVQATPVNVAPAEDGGREERRRRREQQRQNQNPKTEVPAARERHSRLSPGEDSKEVPNPDLHRSEPKLSTAARYPFLLTQRTYERTERVETRIRSSSRREQSSPSEGRTATRPNQEYEDPIPSRRPARELVRELILNVRDLREAEQEREELALQHSMDLSQLFDQAARPYHHKIESCDLKHFFRKLGIPITTEESDLLLNQYDRDGDGTLNFSEFCSLFLPSVGEYRGRMISHIDPNPTKSHLVQYDTERALKRCLLVVLRVEKAFDKTKSQLNGRLHELFDLIDSPHRYHPRASDFHKLFEHYTFPVTDMEVSEVMSRLEPNPSPIRRRNSERSRSQRKSRNEYTETRASYRTETKSTRDIERTTRVTSRYTSPKRLAAEEYTTTKTTTTYSPAREEVTTRIYTPSYHRHYYYSPSYCRYSCCSTCCCWCSDRYTTCCCTCTHVYPRRLATTTEIETVTTKEVPRSRNVSDIVETTTTTSYERPISSRYITETVYDTEVRRYPYEAKRHRFEDSRYPCGYWRD